VTGPGVEKKPVNCAKGGAKGGRVVVCPGGANCAKGGREQTSTMGSVADELGFDPTDKDVVAKEGKQKEKAVIIFAQCP